MANQRGRAAPKVARKRAPSKSANSVLEHHTKRSKTGYASSDDASVSIFDSDNQTDKNTARLWDESTKELIDQSK